MYFQNEDLFFPDIVERRAKESPDSIWLEYPRSATTYDDGFAIITNGALANAVDAVAWLLHRSIPKRSELEPFLYIGPNDARYCIVLYACIKAGYKVLFLSPRNPLPVQSKLLERLDCAAILMPGPRSSSEDAILEAHPMASVVQLPSLEELLETPSEKFPYEKTFKDAQDEPFVVLQSSGTTGDPKPLEYTPQFFARSARDDHLPPPKGHRSLSGMLENARFVCLLPLFHIAGIHFVALMSLYAKGTAILPLSGTPPTSQTLSKMLEHIQATWAIVSPTTIDTLGSDEAALRLVSEKLDRIAFAGGVPAKGLADIVAQSVKLHSWMGSSECGAYSLLVPDSDEKVQELWPFIHVHPSTNPVLEKNTEGLVEILFPKQQTLYAKEEGLFRTKDLFESHPSISNLLKHCGRVDDLIVLSNGEKMTPVAFESSLVMQPLVSGALVFGSGRFELGVLIELLEPVATDDVGKMTELLWPFVQQANKSAPRYGMVAKTHIIFTSPQKPMLRAPKGTIRRHITIQSYQSEIDALYAEIEKGTHSMTSDSPATIGTDPAELVRAGLREVANLERVDEKSDLFLQGFDSLQAIRLSRYLSSRCGFKVEPRLIYDHPSVVLLATALTSSSATNDASLVESTAKFYEELVSQPARHKVLLTGSTGGIGSFLLDKLLENKSVSHVYCLNRSEEPFNLSRYGSLHGEPPQMSTYSPSRVTFLKSNICSGLNLGLENAVFDDLLSSVSVVIHNAWPVDFNLSLASFSTSLYGVANLIRFCERARTNPRLIFLSSVAVAKNGLTPVVQEAAIHNLADALPGYGESKIVAERMIAKANRNLGTRAAIVRIGQVGGMAGSPYGWNSRDWIPRLVISSVYLGCIPSSLGPDDHIDWIPIDTLAAILTDISLKSDQGSNLGYYNVVNPSQTTWKVVLPAICENFKLEQVEPLEWVEKLRQSAPGSGEWGDDGSSNPALPLVEFFQTRFSSLDRPSVSFSVDNTCKVSAAVGLAGPITSDMLVRWAENWTRKRS